MKSGLPAIPLLVNCIRGTDLTVNPSTALIVDGAGHFPGLEQRVDAALESRLRDNAEYSAQEIEIVSGLDRALFPREFEIDSSLFERVQLLAGFSNCALPKSYEIRSHRPVIGKAIVFAKKLAWRFTRAQLEDAFNGVQEFCSWMVHSYAKQAHELAEVKAELREIKKRLQ